MIPIGKDNKWQMALFIELTCMFDSAGEAQSYFMYVHNEEFFEFESSEKRYAIKTSKLCPNLLREVFEMKEWIDQDIKRRRELEDLYNNSIR